MSKLLKSKFLIGMLVLAAFAVSTASADAAITSTLRRGSTGSQVVELQQSLGIVPADGKFGPQTQAAVKVWQASKGLVADGIFGPISRNALGGSVGMGLPAGCTSTVGFSPTTGVACSTTATVVYPAGCSSAAGFSSTTGQPCSSTTVSSGPVSVSLASNNPASGTLVTGQATADLAHFTFMGSGTVTAVTLQRLGVSSDSTPSNIYLFDGATRLTDAASVANNGQVTFSIPSGIFTVNGSKTISVKSDIALLTSGQTLGVMLASFTTAGSSGAATVNLSGNIHTIASATLAAVSAGTVTPTGATINPSANVTVWQSTLNVSQRDVWLKRFALRNVGSASASAFQNFKLYVNGVQVATAAGLDINGYVTFDMNAVPVLLVAGSRVVRVDVDVVSGASRTLQFSLRQAADVDFVDSSFGVNIAPTGTPWAPGTASTISGATGGSLTVEKDVTSPSTNLTLNGSDINLGTFKLTAYGESIKIETLKAGFTYVDVAGGNGGGATLRNGRLIIGGVQYGSTATLVPAGTSFTTNYTVVPGSPVLVEVHADVFDNDGTDDIDATDTLKASLVLGASNAIRVDSLGSFNVPGATVDANTLTVAATTVTLSKNATFTNQNTSFPATNYKIASFNLAGSSVEDVLLTTLSLDINEVVGATLDEDNITNLYPVIKNSSGTVVAQLAPLSTASQDNNNFSVNYTLAKNANATIEFYANFTGTTPTATHSFKTILQVSGTSLVSGQTVTSGDGSTTVEGQTIAYAAATITVSKDASSPVTAIVYDNQEVTTLAAKFEAVTAGYNVTDLTLTLGAGANTVVQNVMLYDGAVPVASAPMSTATTATFSGLAWNIPANTSKVLTVKLQVGPVGTANSGGTTGAVLTTSINAATDVVYTNTSTGVSTSSSTEEAGTAAGSATYAYAATPSIALVSLPSSVLGTGTQTISRFSVTPNGGNIGWKKVIFTVTRVIGGTDTLSGTALYDDSTGLAVPGAVTYSGGIEADEGTAGTIIFIATDEQQLSSAKTYTLKTVVAGTLAAADHINTSIQQPSSFVAPNDYATVAGTAASFAWTDISLTSHSESTLDWSNAFLIKVLPTDTQTLTSPI